MPLEKEAEKLNPLQYAIELMALNERELKKWMLVFENIDKTKEGRITLEDIFMWLEMPPTAFAKHVFISVDALDAVEKLEFGDFIKSIGIYGFFGKEEILRSL